MKNSTLAAAIAVSLGLAALTAGPDAGARPAEDAPAAAGQRWLYIVHFEDAPLAAWRGPVAGNDEQLVELAPTSPEVTGARKLDVTSAASREYLAYLAQRRTTLLGDIAARLGRPVEPEFTYDIATNGVALTLDAAEAERIASLPGVSTVQPEVIRRLMSDAGPGWINADDVWAGTADATIPANLRRGEGAIVGIIDSGIRPTHVSFAGTSGGYTHVNPRSGFLGLCNTSTVLPTDRAYTRPTCNSKLIGIYDFLPTSNRQDEFDDGWDIGRDGTDHGTHVASTAAGNPVTATLGGAPRTLSGVAPRANLISYKVCYINQADVNSPGRCSSAATLKAIDQAITDGVDVLNLSLGGGQDDPYGGISTAEIYNPRPCIYGGGDNTLTACSDTVALLNAREAGIIAAVAAGNDGPGVSTVSNPGNAPWVVTVGAASHNRSLSGSTYQINSAFADVIASFSGRGPNVPVESMMGVLKPDVMAPGSGTGGIIAAYGTETDTTMGGLQGTSMASPGVAGALAVLAAARPSWGPSELHSALMGTARNSVRSGAGNTTPLNPFQQGAGMIDVAAAVRAGLSMPITPAQFRAGNPSAPVNGQPRDMNLPSLVHEECFFECTLTRTFQGLVAGTYAVEPTAMTGVTVTPGSSTITVTAGQTVSVPFTFRITADSRYNQWTYGQVRLRRTNGDGRPDLVLPVAIFGSPGDFPVAIDQGVPSEAGSIDVAFNGILSKTDMKVGATVLAAPQISSFSLTPDPTPANAYDGGQGVQVTNIPLPPSAVALKHRFIVTLTNSAGIDGDLALGISNLQGVAVEAEVKCVSAAASGNEFCDVVIDQPGDNQPYYLFALTQYWGNSANNPSLAAGFGLETVNYPLVRANTPALVATGPGRVATGQAFNVRVAYDDPTFLQGDVRYGELLIQNGTSTAIAANIPLRLTRTSGADVAHALRDNTPHTLSLPANSTHRKLFFDVPPNATSATFSVTSGSEVDLYIARTNPISGAPVVDQSPPLNEAIASATTAGGDHSITLSGAQLQPGRYYVIPRNMSASRVSATVNAVITASGTGPAFRSGQYFNPARNGHGLFVDTTATDFIVLWYTYDQNGAPTWLYGQGRRPASDSDRWNADLYRVSWNGTGPADSTIVGQATITMRPQVNGEPELLYAFTLDGYTGSEPMIRLDTNGCPAYQGAPLNGSGHWFAPSRSGYGFSVDLEPSVEIFATYVYDGLGQPRWLIAQENFNASATSLPLRQFSGFCPSCAATAVSSTPVGTLTRTYSTSSGGDGQPGITTMGVNATFAAPLTGSFVESRAVTLLAARQGCAN